MMTISISLTLTPTQERQLEKLARQNGKDPSVYVNDVVAAYLNGVGSKGEKTFEEILAPIWEGWRQSGMTEDEIDDLFGQELQEVRRERRLISDTSPVYFQLARSLRGRAIRIPSAIHRQ